MWLFLSTKQEFITAGEQVISFSFMNYYDTELIINYETVRASVSSAEVMSVYGYECLWL